MSIDTILEKLYEKKKQMRPNIITKQKKKNVWNNMWWSNKNKMVWVVVKR